MIYLDSNKKTIALGDGFFGLRIYLYSNLSNCLFFFFSDNARANECSATIDFYSNQDSIIAVSVPFAIEQSTVFEFTALSNVSIFIIERIESIRLERFGCIRFIRGCFFYPWLLWFAFQRFYHTDLWLQLLGV